MRSIRKKRADMESAPTGLCEHVTLFFLGKTTIAERAGLVVPDRYRELLLSAYKLTKFPYNPYYESS